MKEYVGANPLWLPDGKGKRILILRPDGIGDLLNSTPAISALRDAFPEARISVLVKALGAEILYNNPEVDESIVFDPDGIHRGIGGKLRLVRQLRHEKYDLAVVLRTSSLCNFLAWASGAKWRVGRCQKRFKSKLTHSTKLLHLKGSLHEIDRNFDILNAIGLRLKGTTKRMRLDLLDDEISWAKGYLRSIGVRDGDFVFGIHPGGSSFDKVWTESGYAKIADRVVGYRADSGCINAVPLIFCAQRDENFVRRIESLMKEKSKRVEKVSVRQMAALISRCHMFICNDSGPMHIAAALGVPLVAIFGPTDHVRWAPKNDNALIVRAGCAANPLRLPTNRRGNPLRLPTIKELPFETVWEKVLELMGNLP